MLVGRDAPEVAVAERTEATYAGRTAAEWERMAERALDAGALDQALKYVKSAELVEAGDQFADELRTVRRLRREAIERRELRDRFLRGQVAHVEYGPDGSVTLAYRTTLALPGESLWTLAQGLAATAGPGADETVVYRCWDRLTDLNGVRELEVGEPVRIPLPVEETAAMAAANRDDMERLAHGQGGIAEGDLARARAALESVDGAYATASVEYARLTEAVERVERERRVEEERDLVTRAHELAGRADTLRRATDYGEYVNALAGARDALARAESLTEGEQYGQAMAAIDRLVSEAQRISVRADGTVLVRRSPGEPFTDAALSAVEWLLERELERGDAQFPHVEDKTADQLAWARFLSAASALAEERGIELSAVIASVDGGEFVLPHPGEYFAH
jgi:hypothetical protein